MIIYLDPYKLLTTQGTYVVTNTTDYIESRKRILAYCRGLSKVAPTILVQEHPVTAWFDDVPQWVVRVSPKSELAKKYQDVLLPTDITDEDIQTLGLLLKDIEPSEQGIQSHYFGQLLNNVAFNEATVFALAQWVVKNSKVLQQRYLKKLWQKRLASLPSYLIPLLQADVAFCKALAEGIYLAGIPALLSEWKHSYSYEFKTKYGSDVNSLTPLLSWKVKKFVDDSVLEQSIENWLIKALQSKEVKPMLLPGIYQAEIMAILTLSPELTREELQVLESKYNNLLTPDLLFKLQNLLPPKLVNPPKLDGLPLEEQANAWKDWAINYFIPYKFWLDDSPNRTSEQICEIESLAENYGDWLYSSYSALLAHDDIHTSYDVRRQVNEILDGTNCRVIWLIIDGLPAAIVPLLEQKLRSHGLIRQTKQFVFSPLPTITDIGIPALTNGLIPNSLTYTINREEALRRSFPSKKVEFASVPLHFKKALSSDADVCCLHWQEIDKMLHRDNNEFDCSLDRWEQIGDKIDERIGMILAVINSRTNCQTKLVISTDHGATKCLRNGLGIKNEKITKAAAANPRERSVKLEGVLLSVNLDEKETYHLTTDVTKNQVAYIAARGYRYFGSNDHGYRHGGLTPEETIVPVIVAEMAAFAVLPLILTYYGDVNGIEQGKTNKTFALQIRNNNPFAIEVRELAIVEDVNCLFPLPIIINSNAGAIINAPIFIHKKYKPQSGQLILNSSLKYIANGEEFIEKTTFAIPIKTNELDDFFGF